MLASDTKHSTGTTITTKNRVQKESTRKIGSTRLEKTLLLLHRQSTTTRTKSVRPTRDCHVSATSNRCNETPKSRPAIVPTGWFQRGAKKTGSAQGAKFGTRSIAKKSSTRRNGGTRTTTIIHLRQTHTDWSIHVSSTL